LGVGGEVGKSPYPPFSKGEKLRLSSISNAYNICAETKAICLEGKDIVTTSPLAKGAGGFKKRIEK
tara:strand:+ start:1481 stop:1678 length:198 start_codon:yes stop_codon:yes gene_type:complete